MAGSSREEKEENAEEDEFYTEDPYPIIACEYEEIPSFRYHLSNPFRRFSWKSWRSSSASSSISSSSRSNESSLPDHIKVYTLQKLKKATKNFHKRNLIWKGMLSHFYVGTIVEGISSRSSMVVGIKKFLPTDKSRQAYDTELHYLSQLNHPNILKLIGYCTENGKRLLVSEFMPNGDLDDLLSNEHRNILSWTLRIKTATQIAGVLSFLHGSERRIIHHLVYPGAILFDSNLNAKLTAFGLAEPIPNSEDAKGPSTKHDVYLFGKVLLALLSGRRYKFPPLTWNNSIDKSSILKFVDTRLEGQYSEEEAYTVGRLAAQCFNAEPHLRPDMQEVLAILRSVQAPKTLHKSFSMK